MTRSDTVYCALHHLHEITSTFDWFTVLPVSFVIGQRDYFGFGFMTLGWNPLYLGHYP